MYPICVKCRYNAADVPEPCCGAPDCVDVVYLICSSCEQAQYAEDLAREWMAREEDW